MALPTIDVGGVNVNRRGSWSPRGNLSSGWVVINPDKDTNPDFLLGGETTPFKTGAFNSVLCAEVLEVAEHPEWIVEEISRLVCRGGIVVITAPFLNQLHPHPTDFQRWTDAKIRHTLEVNRLEVISIDPLGSVFAVIHDLILSALTRAIDIANLEHRSWPSFLLRVVRKTVRSSFWLWAVADKKAHRVSPWINTGWAVIATKK